MCCIKTLSLCYVEGSQFSLCSVLVISDSGFMKTCEKKELQGELESLDCAAGTFAYFLNFGA